MANRVFCTLTGFCVLALSACGGTSPGAADGGNDDASNALDGEASSASDGMPPAAIGDATVDAATTMDATSDDGGRTALDATADGDASPVDAGGSTLDAATDSPNVDATTDGGGSALDAMADGGTPAIDAGNVPFDATSDGAIPGNQDAGASDAAVSDAAPPGCLAEGVYYVPFTSSDSLANYPPPTFACSYSSTSVSGIAEIQIINDPTAGWTAALVAPSTVIALGRFPIVATTAGFSSTGSYGYTCIRRGGGPTGGGVFTFSVDCATRTATLGETCVGSWPNPCASGDPYSATLTGSCTSCTDAGAAGD
jgi:hypothetical protein